MLTKQDINRLKSQVEFAMEVLLRAADQRVSWKQSGDSSPPEGPVYAFLPGVYTSVAPQTASLQPQQQDEGTHDQAKVAPLKSAMSSRSSIAQPSHQPSSLAPIGPATDTAEGDGSKTRIVLHGDNTFEYVWTMKRSGARAMEFTVEMEGPDDFNLGERALTACHVGTLTSVDTENQTWKLCLRTLTRHGSDWANVGQTERGIPPIVMVFQCVNGCLESTGAALPAQILSNLPACRILAGLTKKIANKLGAPVDVMTEKWLPVRGVRLAVAEDTNGVKVKNFNPFYWYVAI
ncbi:unnamed protein product [Phytophthora lilii]|uniref:Unnamed protein product n=1 Tax=Phytophthora lilii TaxID=2077276 RepID=A0A9W6TB16_9STRA|nr:unnamed protein product [Phytophthora lilii]